MLNIRHLEQQWLRYRVKKYLPFIAALIATAVLLALAWFFFLHQKNPTEHSLKPETGAPLAAAIPEENLHVNHTSPTPQQAGVPTPTTPPSATSLPVSQPTRPGTAVADVSYEPKKLKPSYDFLSNITYEAAKEQPPKTSKPIQPPKPQRQQLNTAIAPAVEKKIDTILKPETTTPTPRSVTKPAVSVPKGIKISRIKSQGEIQDIIHRFKANKSPVLGLYLARYYYKMQNYKKAYNYALNTNNIDPNIEESWLIFASSQMKLSKKNQAVKTLKAYIRNSGSSNAKSLLNSIQNGEFK